MQPTRILVTGASGFVGRHLLDATKDDYRIFGIARRSQARAGAPVHPNIRWHQVDIGDRESLRLAFREIRDDGGVDTVIHLAAHYDFTGEDHPAYWRTNVEGLRNVLDFSRDLGVRHFVFSSSTAACRFPPSGGTIDETTPPDGTSIYSVTKGIGEAMVREYEKWFPATIVRYAALFSDWCEYPPLFIFLETWLSGVWNHRVLAGRGKSAIPYMHVREVAPFLQRVLDRGTDLPPGQVVIASPDGSTSHAQLFEAATTYFHGRPDVPRLFPKWLCSVGVRAMDAAGRVTGNRPFERPWMMEYVDKALHIDASRTRKILGWAPRERLDIIRRMPFLIENFRVDPLEWHRRNRAAMRRLRVSTNLRIFSLLERFEERIGRDLTAYGFGPEGRPRLPHYQALGEDLHQWHHVLVLRNLMNAVRTRDRGIFLGYCDDLAKRRYAQGFPSAEVCHVLEMLGEIALRTLRRDPESDGLEQGLQEHVTMNLRFGCDRVLEVYETLEESGRREGERAAAALRGDD